MTDDDFECRLCEEETRHLFSCRECSRLFCDEHIDPDDHFCGASAFNVTLSNGSSYYFPVSGWRRRLIARYQERGFLGRLLSVIFASPVTFAMLVIMWLWFVFVQVHTLALMGPDQFEEWSRLFGLTADGIQQPWMWLVAMFSHGNLIHIVVNSLVLAMFGPFVERRVGTWPFAVLFLVTGLVTVVAQVGAAMVAGATLLPVMGASGAIAGVLGVYATVEPDVRVWLFFVLPLSMWLAASFVVVGSFLIPVFWGIGAFGLAHIAHGTGLVMGILIGLHHDSGPLRAHLLGVARRWQAAGQAIKLAVARVRP